MAGRGCEISKSNFPARTHARAGQLKKACVISLIALDVKKYPTIHPTYSTAPLNLSIGFHGRIIPAALQCSTDVPIVGLSRALPYRIEILSSMRRIAEKRWRH